MASSNKIQFGSVQCSAVQFSGTVASSRTNIMLRGAGAASSVNIGITKTRKLAVADLQCTDTSYEQLLMQSESATTEAWDSQAARCMSGSSPGIWGRSGITSEVLILEQEW